LLFDGAHRIEDRHLHDRHQPVADGAPSGLAGDRTGNLVPVRDDVGMDRNGREPKGNGEGDCSAAE